ncbi:MAG TPA: hypothetical protein DD381_09390 [Lentisphaeria bacterium]|nr:MAG: hypothetical protein A2X47_11435 [Lentisphaerae bacterium GWF2_38_69]HBM16537.1 hypothetical protein [Lentisphaeria bacterium]
MSTICNIDDLQKILCASFCADIKVARKNEHLIRVETPFYFPDGDPYQIYLKEISTGGFKITDAGHTLMHLSYENDIDEFQKGTRGALLQQIQLETGMKEDDGEFYLESASNEIHINLFRFGQALTKIYDLTFLNRTRVENTFYEDLDRSIIKIVDEEKIIRDYIFKGMESAEDYPIDYYIKGKKEEPLYLFGIPNRDKARLTTIIIERLLRHNAKFESLIVFSDFDSVPKNDSKRLINVGGEIISSLDAKDDLSRKILKRVA